MDITPKNKIKPAKGRLLISAPALHDIFKRSVILITEHNDEGSIGFILNKKVDSRLHTIIPDFPEFDAPVYIGGPVQPEMLNFIHCCPEQIQGGHPLGNGIFWGGNFDILTILAESGELDPQKFKFFIGYSGWGEGQLANELVENAWYVTKCTANEVFTNENKMWSAILRNMGGNYKIISTFPEDPIVN